MSKVTIVGHKSSRKGVLETLQRRGAMEIETASLPEGYSLPDTSGQIQFFDSSAAEGRQALEILNGVAPIKQSVLASFKGRRELSVDAFHERLADIKKTNAAVGDINALKKQMNDCAAEVARLTLQLAETEPWLSLDIPMAHRGTKDMAVFTGALPYSADEQEILTRLAQTAPEVNLFDLEIVSQGREQTCIAAFCHRAQVAEFETALRGIGFTVPTHLSMRTARLRAKSLNERKMALEMEIPLLESLIKTLAPHREDIELLVDYYSMRSDKYEKISRLAVGKNVFAISGYIPAKYA
ncbi:MAG TPA: hypothetical protein DEQ02_07790, partial [Ruminococcaceae bacterium]|nr:hypothetical protein [Oscillospiraceae bacterium]